MFQKYKWVVVSLLLLLSSQALAAKKQYICVFDPVGRDGDVFSIGKDLATEYLSLGVELKLYPYSTEASAIQDLKAGLCDGAVITGLRTREFNLFSSTIESVGTIRDYDSLRLVVETLTQPKAGKLFVQGEYEVAGVFPAGAVYIFTRDKSWRTIEAFKNRRVIVMYGDRVSQTMVERVNATPVKGDTSTFANKFKRGNVDVIFSPAAVYEPLELYKGLEPDGGIIKEPIAQLTLQIVIRKEAFPDGFGQAAREIALDHFDRALDIAHKSEAKIENNFWVKPNPIDVERTMDLAREVRVQLRDEGIYDGRMLKILRKLRCRNEPNHKECSNPVE